jgi:hypothetical protein
MTVPAINPHGRLASIGVWRLSLAAALAVAGVMHLVLTADHFGESVLMGLGFAGATVAELGLAGAVLVRPSRLVYSAVVVVGAALVALYVYNVFIGLPFAGGHVAPELQNGAAVESVGGTTEHGEPHEAAGHGEGQNHSDHHDEGLALGAGEPVDAAGAATKGAELVSIGIAAGLLLRARRPQA